MASPDSDSKDWIKARISTLRKQANLNFNQDLFISILLCLVSHPDDHPNHLLLTTTPNQIHHVATMAEQICHSIFGLTCAAVKCGQDQTPTDFVASLFTTHHTFAVPSPNNHQNNADDQPTSRPTPLRAQKSARSIKTLGSVYSTTNNESAAAAASGSSSRHVRKESNHSVAGIKASTRKRSSSAATSRKSHEKMDQPSSSTTASSSRYDTPTRNSSQPLLLSLPTALSGGGGSSGGGGGGSVLDEQNQLIDPSDAKDRILPTSLRTAFSVSNNNLNASNSSAARRVRHSDDPFNAHVRLSLSSVISTNTPAASGTASRRNTISITATTPGGSTGHSHGNGHVHSILGISAPHSPTSLSASPTPISPLDFTLTRRRRESSAAGTPLNVGGGGPSRGLSMSGDLGNSDHGNEGRNGADEPSYDHGGSSSGIGTPGGGAHGHTGAGAVGSSFYPSGSKRLAQAVVLEGLSTASELVQASLLEVLIRRQVTTDRATVYPTPRPFIVIAIVPKSKAGERTRMLSQLIDRFYISYTFDAALDKEGTIPVSPTHESATQQSRRTSGSPSLMGRRTSLLKTSELEELSVQASKVTVSNDITRYIRDIVVGIRTHRMVQGGLTTRSSTDLVEVLRALAAIFRLDYVTPELVLIASEKVLAHRLVLVDQPVSADDDHHEDDDDDVVEAGGDVRENPNADGNDQMVSDDGSAVANRKRSSKRVSLSHQRRTSSNSLSWTGNEKEEGLEEGEDGRKRKIKWVTPAEVLADVLQVVWPPV
ncbi:hypothetical protein BC938DRAFT_477223 [Jimgerdemannia flammicorona]|uniref:magnesium chelatase n=1 Tax=Jimgerdemannia flammicorona TaxID=994334 RepID=A0A433QPL3_9FUNG|nr:hypothetical protein BC938DRAFT_477223 [Jimgerdemannia flammicorona]